MSWRSLHVVYYDRDKDHLLLEAVRPFFRRLSSTIPAMSFTRHWRLGPHVRLHLRCDAATMAGVVRPAARETIGGFLSRHPSRTVLAPEEYEQRHRELARLEDEHGPLTPWRPNNTLHEAPFERRPRALGSEEAVDLLADFHADTTELAFRILQDVSTGRPRLGHALDLMIATAHVLSGVGVTTGFMSFRSHADAFLAMYPGAETLRGPWDDHYRLHEATLRRRVSDTVAGLDGDAPTSEFVADWTSITRSYHVRASQLLARGQLPTEHGFSTDANGNPPPLVHVSPYHRAAFHNPAVMDSMTAHWFVLYRTMLNHTYLFLTQLGVTPQERFLLCHLAARAVEDVFGVSAMRQIEEEPPAPTSDIREEPV
ncbi:hypothetical protein J4H86_20975 [Spiractinospora alimapuensis]|uniref:thiopeptide maturation pyridine synthase n=1 Tax=Spiractinospora alimapuensis TaxID=2820884 RepID=UPI001F18AE05|nr:thiopeptide maturation pyridine synthase [Spiractinospora alimapuensis]QVQ51270.1 hypothetical protein J4H86_20975 [Spiractinospora alimapuensis]